jgi:hypothetical protein
MSVCLAIRSSFRPQSTYRVEMKEMECICPLSSSVHYNFVHYGYRLKVGGRAPPTLTSQGGFSIMMGCTSEIGNRHSVCTL